uniref:Uncharacterized protein n=1 Tax=Timema douglasi TaxID=61478 RepID=A0A7R8ZF94_TIMDO|nr:unnamed protein product [Timema douglasi]
MGEVVTNCVDMLRRSSIIFQAFFLLTFSTYLASAIKCYECFPSSGHDCSSVSGSTPKNCTVESVEKTMALVSGAPRSMLGIDEGSFKCLMIKGVYKFIREVKSHDNDSVLKQQISPFADILAWRNCQVGSSESGNSRTVNVHLLPTSWSDSSDIQLFA